MNEKHDQECDHIARSDVCEEDVTRDISDSEHTQYITSAGIDVSQVVGDVDRDENTTADECDCREEVSKHAKETKECDGI